MGLRAVLISGDGLVAGTYPGMAVGLADGVAQVLRAGVVQFRSLLTGLLRVIVQQLHEEDFEESMLSQESFGLSHA